MGKSYIRIMRLLKLLREEKLWEAVGKIEDSEPWMEMVTLVNDGKVGYSCFNLFSSQIILCP